jgi:uncharacterized coiled-coil protein SlyX
MEERIEMLERQAERQDAMISGMLNELKKASEVITRLSDKIIAISEELYDLQDKVATLQARGE